MTDEQAIPFSQPARHRSLQAQVRWGSHVVTVGGDAPVRVVDVARVTEGFVAPIGNAIIDDGPGIMLIVEKQPTGNTLQLTRDVEAAVEEMRPGLKDVKIDTTIFRPATFIEKSIESVPIGRIGAQAITEDLVATAGAVEVEALLQIAGD